MVTRDGDKKIFFGDVENQHVFSGGDVDGDVISDDIPQPLVQKNDVRNKLYQRIIIKIQNSFAKNETKVVFEAIRQK